MVTSIKDICKYPGCTNKTVIHLKAKVDAESQSIKDLADDLHYEVDICADHLGNGTHFLHCSISDNCDFVPSVKFDIIKVEDENHANNYDIVERDGKVVGIKGKGFSKELERIGFGNQPLVEKLKALKEEQKSLTPEISNGNYDVIEVEVEVDGKVVDVKNARSSEELERAMVEKAKNMKHPRPLYAIAIEIISDWKNPSIRAASYINALAVLPDISHSYLHDSGSDIVLRFLSNARTWRGEIARRIKKELKRMYEELNDKGV